MSYAFRKLYADLISEDGTVCVVYVTWLEALGLVLPYAGVEIYWPDGRREVLHASRPPPSLDSRHPPDRLEFELELPGGRAKFAQRVVHGAWEPASPAACSGLTWSVLVGRAAAELRWLDDSKRPTLRGGSYADWVVLTRLTRRLGLASIEWGRIHFETRTQVFNRITLRQGLEWQRCAAWSGGAPDETADVGLAWTAGEAHLTAGGAGVILAPARVLHDGSPLDAARIPNRAERLVASAMTGRSRETRWLSHARAVGDARDTGWALHEEVRFGA